MEQQPAQLIIRAKAKKPGDLVAHHECWVGVRLPDGSEHLLRCYAASVHIEPEQLVRAEVGLYVEELEYEGPVDCDAIVRTFTPEGEQNEVDVHFTGLRLEDAVCDETPEGEEPLDDPEEKKG